MVHDETGFRTQSWYVLSSDVAQPISSEIVSAFLLQTNTLELASSEALRLLMGVLSDSQWLERIVVHMSSCIEGVPYSQASFTTALTRHQALDSFACGKAAFTAIATVFTTYSCLAIPVPLLNIACAAGALGYGAMETGERFIECACTEPGAKTVIGCGVPTCVPQDCNSACEGFAPRYCQNAKSYHGTCEDQPIDALANHGFSAVQCQCYATYDDEEIACDGGDPHIRTWDNFGYSPHVAGEFVAARSEIGDFELQVRQEQRNSDICSVAVNTATALRLGDTVVMVAARNVMSDIIVDGTQMTVASNSSIGLGDLVISRQGPLLIVRNERAYLLVDHRPNDLNLSLHLVDDGIDDVVGLFGTANGDASDDLQNASGEIFASPIHASVLAEDVVRSWQVDADTTLFTYQPAETYETYLDESFPDSYTSIDDLDEALRATAEQACERAGVTNDIALRNCVLDVACTQDASFADAQVGVHYEAALEVVDDTRAATGDCPELREIPCMTIDRQTMLDGVVMTCSGDLPIRAPLTLRNGATLRVGGRITVAAGGYVDAAGSQMCPIVITSDEEEPQAGGLRWVSLQSDSLPSTFRHVVFEFGGDDGVGTNYLLHAAAGAAVSLQDVTFRNVLANALDVRGKLLKAQNLRFEEVGGHPVAISPNNAAALEQLDLGPSVARPTVYVHAGTVSEPGTWSMVDAPYALGGDIAFESAVRFAPGTHLEIEADTRFFVQDGGSLHADGTAAATVVIRGAANNPEAGQWRQFAFRTTAQPSSFRHTLISHGGGAGFGALEVGAAVTLDHVSFHHNLGCDVAVTSTGNVQSVSTELVPCN